MKLLIKLYDITNVSINILKQVETIGCDEIMLPIYYEEDSLKSELTCNNSFLLVITNEDNLVLSFLIYTLDENSVHIKSICIKQQYKRYRLGSHLINYLKNNYNKVTLYVQSINTVAFQFYKKNGFIIERDVIDYYQSLEHKQAYYMIYSKNRSIV